MKNLSKFVILLVILSVQSLYSQTSQIRNCDSLKTIKLSTCDMDDITTVFRDRRKYMQLNVVNDSIIKNDSIIISNYKKMIKNDSISIVNYKKNGFDKDFIIGKQQSIIKSEQSKTKFFKITTYTSSGVAFVLLIINLLK